MQRQGALNACFDLIYNADPNGSIWYVAVSSHNKIVLDFRTKMQWPAAKATEIYEEEEAKLDVKHKCMTCKELFTKRENDSTEYKCKVHDNLDWFIFEEKETKLKVSLEQAKLMIS